MEIILLRHGKPDIPDFGKLEANKLHHWIDGYDSAKLNSESKPPQNVIELADNCNVIVCSDLNRSIEPAKALGLSEINYNETMFREAELPYGDFPLLKLAPSTWSVLYRFLWFLGYSRNSESLADAKLRAKSCAQRLKKISNNSGTVMLVGHAFLNGFIAKELIANGWRGPSRPSNKYWEFGVYRYPKGAGLF